jgi:hypothetical protein
MGYWPESVEAEARVCPLRRRRPRVAVRSLTYVKLDDGNGGIIRDLTESGVAVQAVGPLQMGQEVQLRFEVNSPRVRVEARGRVAWADWGGKAGIQFLDVTPRGQRALRDWLLLQVLSAAAASGRDSMFSSRELDLTFSAPRRTAIVVEAPGPWVEWGGFSVSAPAVAIFVDAVVLVCALLVFAIGALVGMGGVQGWPMALALMVVTAGIFAAVYWGMFSWVGGGTVGSRVAKAACVSAQVERVQRFR